MKHIYTFLLFIFLIVKTLSAQEGSLDASFNTTGKVVTPFAGFSGYCYAAAIQSDGKIIAVGYTADGYNNRFAVTRYNSNGSLDNSFGTGGKVITEVSPGIDDQAAAVVIQSDGKIVVGGSAYDAGQNQFALVRYDTSGTIDGDFGTGGIVKTPIGTNDDRITSLALQSDGKIVAGGISDGNGSYQYRFAVVRYNSDGTLDTGFDGDGIVTTHIRSGIDKLKAIAIQSDGKIIAAGHSDGPSLEYDCAVVRYTTSGSLDSTFDTDGIVTPVGVNSSTINSIAIQSDGKIVAGGYASPASNYIFSVVRYNTNGTLDTGFDTDGKVMISVGSGENEINCIALQSDGKIVAAGMATTNFALARFNANGSLDTGFDTDGKVSTPIGSNSSVGRSVSIQSDGKIIVAGYSTDDGTDYSFAVARYNGAVPSTGYALRFDGIDDYVSVPSAVWFNGNFTVEAWVYEYNYNDWSRIIDFANGASSDNVLIALSTGAAGTVSFHIFEGSSSEFIETPDPLPLNQWNHIACVWNAGTATIYINGTAVISGSVHAPNNVTRTTNYIGKSNWADQYVDAKMDEIRIWNIALDSTAIQQRMHRTIDPGSANLAAYWQFNNSSGAIAQESHGYAGTLNNFNFTGTSGWTASTIPAGPGTTTSVSGFTSGTQSLGDISLTTTDGFDNPVDLHATVLSAIPNTVPGSYSSVIGDKYYVVNAFGAPGSYTFNLTINFGASMLDTRVDANPGGVRLYKRSSISDGSWTLVGGASSANSTTGNVTWNGITSFGQFAAVYEESALPVELTSFTASAQQNGVELQWTTATEINNYGFEVERKQIPLVPSGHSPFVKRETSEDPKGQDPTGQASGGFIKVGFVEGSGTTNALKEYSFTDKNLLTGKNVYRLKQIDRDGKFTYSNIVEVAVGVVPKEFKLEQNFPNPFNPSTTIGFTLQVSGFTTLKIYDAIGREVTTLVNENLEAGVYYQKIFPATGGDASTYSSGIYFAKLQSGGKVQLKKMMLIK